jgi:hypothetical protein
LHSSIFQVNASSLFALLCDKKQAVSSWKDLFPIGTGVLEEEASLPLFHVSGSFLIQMA